MFQPPLSPYIPLHGHMIEGYAIFLRPIFFWGHPVAVLKSYLLVVADWVGGCILILVSGPVLFDISTLR